MNSLPSLFAQPGTFFHISRYHVCFAILACLLFAACVPAQPPSAPAAAEAAPAPAATAAPAAAPAATNAIDETSCNPAHQSVISAWGSEGYQPNFYTIARDFASYAESSGFEVTRPESYEAMLWANMEPMQQIDEYTVGFYTAHGNPDQFESLTGISVTVQSLLLGQCDAAQQSQLRYLIVSACNTFAHGPQVCSGTTKQYACPGEWQFDSQGDTEAMRSIFDRWGPALGNGIRMACGSSTDLPPGNAVSIWSTYGGNQSVADTILASLSNQLDVGLCLARGGRDFAESPLMDDTSFLTVSNPYDNGADVYYHLQYAKPFAEPYRPVHGVLIDELQVEMGQQAEKFARISESAPECLPVLEHIPKSPQSTSANPQSQSLSDYSSEREALAEAPSESAYIANAQENLGSLEFGDIAVRPDFAYGTRLLLATFPADPAKQNQDTLRVTEKGVIVTFPQLFRLDQVEGVPELERPQDLESLLAFHKRIAETYEDPRPLPIEKTEDETQSVPLVRRLLGDITVQLNPDLSLISGINKWRPIGKALASEQLRRPDEVFLQSLQQLYQADVDSADILVWLENEFGNDGAQPYRLESWEWGYAFTRRETGFGSLLTIRYNFRYAPNQDAGYDAAKYPPVYIQVDGQNGEICSQP